MKIKVIVNPKAGKRTTQRQLERIMGQLLMSGLADRVDLTRTEARGHATQVTAALAPGEYDLIIACGGDGTINEVLNGLMSSGSGIPLAILAAGTSNDFAFALRLPDTAEGFCKMVRAANYRQVDIGCANGRYFINAAAFGMFTEVAHGTDQRSKNSLGKLAYYLQAIREAPEQLGSSMPLIVSSAEYTNCGEYHVCLVVNSMSVASIRRLMYKADVSDGVFDVLLMKKKKPLREAGSLVRVIQKSGERFFQLRPGDRPAPALGERPPFPLLGGLREQLITEGMDPDPAFVYFQTSRIEFRTLGSQEIVTDVDGELFGRLPLTIEVAPRAVRLLTPPEEEAPPPMLRLP